MIILIMIIIIIIVIMIIVIIVITIVIMMMKSYHCNTIRVDPICPQPSVLRQCFLLVFLRGSHHKLVDNIAYPYLALFI